MEVARQPAVQHKPSIIELAEELSNRLITTCFKASVGKRGDRVWRGLSLNDHGKGIDSIGSPEVRDCLSTLGAAAPSAGRSRSRRRRRGGSNQRTATERIG